MAMVMCMSSKYLGMCRVLGVISKCHNADSVSSGCGGVVGIGRNSNLTTIHVVVVYVQSFCTLLEYAEYSSIYDISRKSNMLLQRLGLSQIYDIFEVNNGIFEVKNYIFESKMTFLSEK